MLWQLMRSQCFDADAGGGEGGGDKGDAQSGKDAANGGDKSADGKGGESREFKPITSQEDFDAALKERLTRHEKTIAKSLSEKIKNELKAEQDAKKAEEDGNFKALFETEKQKREAAERERDTERMSALKTRIGAKHKLPDALVARLVGTTEDELEADAKELAKTVGARQAPDNDMGRGNKGGNPPKDKTKADGPVYTFDGKAKVAWPDR